MSALGIIGMVFGGFGGVALLGTVEKQLGPHTLGESITGFPLLLVCFGGSLMGGVAVGYLVGDTLETTLCGPPGPVVPMI